MNATGGHATDGGDRDDAAGDTRHVDGQGEHEDHGHESYREQSGETRVTSPMQRFTAGEVGYGAVILMVGVAVAFVLPLLLVS